MFCRDGEEFLFRTALGILKLFEDILTKMDFIHMAQFLTRLPEDLPAEELFASIATIQMQSRNKKWAQVSGLCVLGFPQRSWQVACSGRTLHKVLSEDVAPLKEVPGWK